jgi:hypothetical protein
MFTMVTESTRRATSAVAAVAVVVFAGLTLDQGHAGALPQGTVEVGELTPVEVMQMAAVTLPEIVVRGARIDSGRDASATASNSSLPALAAAAGKAVFDAGAPRRAKAASPASVLLQ